MENSNEQWKDIYLIGGIATIIVLCGIIADMGISSIIGGNIASLPKTAIERFSQFKDDWLIGLYNLDLLNTINQIIMIPAFFAVYAAHRKVNNAAALLALILFLVGTAIFVANNTALTMLDLSGKYFSAASEAQKNLYAAAGEAMLAKGSHGTLGVFIGFALPIIANIIMSFVMFKGNIFSKTNSYLGFIGGSFMLVYLVLVTFIPAVEKAALAFAMPGGLLLMAWMVMFAVKLFKLHKTEN